MQFHHAAALALLCASQLSAQTLADLSFATPIAGEWTYYAASDGSEARFSDQSGTPQLLVHCTRSTRRVSISKPSSVPLSILAVWTSSQARSIPASFNPATGRLTIDLEAYDSLLDALSTSRGRIGITAGAQAPLVLPAWAELARVVEDCRS